MVAKRRGAGKAGRARGCSWERVSLCPPPPASGWTPARPPPTHSCVRSPSLVVSLLTSSDKVKGQTSKLAWLDWANSVFLCPCYLCFSSGGTFHHLEQRRQQRHVAISLWKEFSVAILHVFFMAKAIPACYKICICGRNLQPGM